MPNEETACPPKRIVKSRLRQSGRSDAVDCGAARVDSVRELVMGCMVSRTEGGSLTEI